MKKQITIFTRRLLSVTLAISMILPTSYVGREVSAADINNIGAPVYTVTKNMDGTDAFVYAYNVLEYGADNTGNNDNTDIFQKLLNKANSLGGGIVYVPSGRYKITGALKIPKGVTLRGDWTQPTAGKTINSGTILLAYTGRGGDERTTPFIEMEPETGCMELTIWYPEQTPDNITKYSPTIRLGVNNYFGNEYTNVKNVTLLNSYIGILFNYDNGGASPVINGIYGTPLYRGIDMDHLVDIGRMEHINFSPDYWSGSGMAGAPTAGSSFEDYIYNNATGIVMKRNDWSYTCFVDIDGYNIGYNTQYSIENNGSTPNGNHYNFNLRNCKNGIVFDATNSVGILFDSITMYNCENGIVTSQGTGDVAQFSNSKLTCSKYAVKMDKTSTTKLLMYDSVIDKGLVNVDGGTFMCSGTTFNNKAPEIVIGSLGRVSLSANTFTNGKQIINNSIYVSELDNAYVDQIDVPEFPDEKASFQSHMPSNLTLYDVTKAPYYANNSSSHGGGNDCTNAIQSALNDASANGGGIVFLPSGHYRVDGQLYIPANVELRGATDLSSVPHGSGAILESYANKGNPNGEVFIKISANAGIRGVIINYPEQTYSVDSNGDYYPYDYPYTMQGLGENIYVINVGIRAATGALDLDTYRCDNHYVDFLAGHVNKVCVKVGNGSRNGIINNLMFNTIVYGCGQESKYGGFPNSPNTPAGVSNSPVYNQQLRDLEFLVVGDCENEALYNCFPYGAYIGTKFINEGNGGPQNLISMGLGIDGSRKSMYFGSGLTGKMEFINSQIVSLNNDQPITRYFETESNTYFTANLFNTDLWGYPEKSVVMGTNGGTLNLYTANFQFRGYNGALNVGDGSKVNVTSSNFNSHSSAFSTGSNNISLVSTIADYTTSEGNSFAQNIANFSSALELNTGNTANMLDRTGWTATASTYNENAWKSLDGDLYSQWSTQGVQTAGQWYQVDMGSQKSFDLIVTTLGTTNDVPRGYKVMISNDGNNWTTVATGENKNVYSVGDQTARYIRIEQTGSESHWWAVYEFYVMKSTTYDVGEGEVIEEEPTNPPTEEETTTEEVTTADPTTLGGTVLTASQATVDTAALNADANAYGGYTIGNMHLEGASFTFNNVYGGKKGGRANILVHYASNESNVTLGLNVNNADSYVLSCPITGGWSTFTGTTTTQVNLNSGYTNTLTFANATQGVNVDYVVVTLLDDVEDYVAGNIALGKTATASGYENDDMTPAKALDGDTGTRWSSDFADNAWIIVDLEKTYSIGKVVLNWEAAYGTSYDIQVSTDGTNWTTVKSLTNQDGGEDVIKFNAVDARYVKMQGVTRALEYGYSLWEMEVYCSDGSSYEEETTAPETTTEEEVTVPETTTEEETTAESAITISSAVKTEGYQISSVLKGLRVISSVEPTINGKQVVSSGNIYAVDAGDFSESDMVLGSTNQYVKNYEHTSSGVINKQMGSSATATYYAMTMINNGTSVSSYTRTYYVRGYAVLEDGSVVYSTVDNYSIYRVADYLYKNNNMPNYSGHSYLYNDILTVVNPDYKEIDYNWNNQLVMP